MGPFQIFYASSLQKFYFAFHNLLPTHCPLRWQWRYFPGGPVVKDLLGNPRDTGSIPGQGTKLESHMPWSNTEPTLHN